MSRSSTSPPLPKSLIIIGAGAVGVEFRLHLPSLRDAGDGHRDAARIGPGWRDEDISKELERIFRKRNARRNRRAARETSGKPAKA